MKALKKTKVVDRIREAFRFLPRQIRRKKVADRIREAYRVEALEPRILLSGDPVLGAAKIILFQDPDDQQIVRDSYQPGQHDDVGVPSGVRQCRHRVLDHR